MSLFGGSELSEPTSGQEFANHTSWPLQDPSDVTDFSDQGSPSTSASEYLHDDSRDDESASLAWAHTALHDSNEKDRWRRATRSERDVFEDLRRLECDDLSVHLCNAHVLKSRVYDTEKRDERSFRGRLKDKGQLRNPASWVPSRKWTAWPLALDEVPLENEHWGIGRSEEELIETTPPDDVLQRPSDELRELLSAECLREANFVHKTLKGNTQSDQGLDYVSGDNAREHTSDSGTASGRSTRSSHHSPESADVRNSPHFLPGPALADANIQAALEPVVSSTLQDFDYLLRALSRSRSTHHIHGKKRRHGKDTSTPSEHVETSKTSMISLKRDRSKSHAVRRLKRARPSPRDWSEVLGTAALVGWDRRIVGAAQRRCERLLGEEMQMREIRADDIPARPGIRTDHGHVGRREEIMQSIEQAEVDRTTTSSSALVYRCPEASCAVEHPSRSEWLRHISSAHGYKYTGVENVVQRTSQTGSKLCCPDPDCQRHEWPFPTQWRLKEHIQRSHGGVAKAKSPSPAAIEELHCGTHVDGFLQPILAQRWRSDSRSRSTSRTTNRSEAE